VPAADDGPLCHFEVDEHGNVHQRVDPTSLAPFNDYAYGERITYLGFDGCRCASDAWDTVMLELAGRNMLAAYVVPTRRVVDDGWIARLYAEHVAARDEDGRRPGPWSWQPVVSEWIDEWAEHSNRVELTAEQEQLLYTIHVGGRRNGRGRHLEMSTATHWQTPDETRTTWQQTLDKIRTDWHHQHRHGRLWAERDLDVADC